MGGRGRRLVYFARRVDGTGPIKIGCSSCPASRVRQLGWDHGTVFKILAMARGGLAAERWLHRRFAEDRAAIQTHKPSRATAIAGSSEWFTATAALLALIDDLNADRVELPSVDERDLAIISRRRAGETLQAIGSDFGLTRERVRQIVRELEPRAAA